ncbi:hypothetical protein BFP71_08765 [Roseivirga misakiensis]|uniref:Uncharacterized protein n=2 Tax=Roseivirga misakiensis TaxID=1563681 RepID=A0A1E5SKN5_9BACT|nr:hypothetical protein BFP71_08765 [Roseivirga misakiensis]
MSAQSYMVVRKKGGSRRYEYRPGNYLVYLQKGNTQFFRDRITEFADSTIVLENNILRLNQIETIDVSNAFSNRSRLLRGVEEVLPVAGVGYFALDIFNDSVIDGNRLSLDEGVTVTSGALVLSGFMLKWMRRKKVDLTNPKFEAYIVGF